MEGGSGTEIQTTETSSAPFYLDETDLVRVVSLDVLATVEHIGGESSSDDDSDVSSMEEDGDSDDDEDIPLRLHHARIYLHHDRHGNLVPKHHCLIHGSEETTNTDDQMPPRIVDENFDDADESSDDEEEDEANTGGDLDEGFYEDVQEDDDEDYDETPEVPIGSALVTRIDNGEDVVVQLEDLVLVDRIMAPGQLVLSAVKDDSNVQTGIVQSLNKKLIVRRMAGSDAANSNQSSDVFEVPAEKVFFFCDVRIDSYVVSRNWLGVVEFCQVDVYVDFPDGSVGVVPGHPERLMSDDPRVTVSPNPDFEGFYFPGMKVKANSRVWRDATWLRGKFRRQRSGVVRYTKTTNVGVQWIAVRQNIEVGQDGAPPSPPPEIIPYSEVRPLDAYRFLWWRAGDCALLPNRRTTEDEEWVEQTPSLPTPPQALERVARPRSARRHPPRGTGRLIAAQRRTRELSSLEDPNSADSSLMAEPSAVVQILETKTTVSVLWQSGKLEHDVPSINLRVNEHPGASDFWPGMIVSRTMENVDLPSKPRTDAMSDATQTESSSMEVVRSESPLPNHHNEQRGTVVRVVLDERTAVVRWQKPNSREYHSEEEEVSVYDLVSRSDDVQLGDTVLLVGDEGSVPDDANGERRWIGQIVDKGVGDVEVIWLGGERSRITPDQLLVVGDDDDSEASAVSDEETDDIAFHGAAVGLSGTQNVTDPALRDNWALDDSAPLDIEQAVHKELRVVFEFSSRISKQAFGRTVDFENAESKLKEGIAQYSGSLNPEKHITSSIIIAKFVHNVAIHVVTQCVNELSEDVGSSDAASGTNDGKSELPSTEEGPPWPSTENVSRWPHPSWNRLQTRIREVILDHFKGKGIFLDSGDKTNEESNANGGGGSAQMIQCAEMKATQNDSATLVPMETDDVSPSLEADRALSETFEVLEDLERHYFANRSSSSTGHSRLPGFANIVRKEWMRLRKNLPNGIYVHASEQNQDLLRAAIIGPKDTPYEDIMFYFDILLPNYYPAEPPRVNFLSHGRRLNPNLYEDGKVCLSILGTWDGDDVEQWDARNSNVLRVLLSLQAMVFVEQPYYNEAGYQKQVGTVEGRTNARTYNESTLLLCLRHLMQSIRPGGAPSDFVDLQRKHYRCRSGRIIKRLENLSVLEVANSGSSNSTAGPSSEQYTSRGFKRSLAELVPRVANTFKTLDK